MIYKISTADFQKQSGDFDLIRIVGDFVYLNSDKSLKKPFVSVSDSELPIECAEALKERENAIVTMREVKIREINEARDNEIAQGVEYNGKIYQSDERDQMLITQSVVLYSAQGKTPKGFAWIAKDNSFNEFSLQDLIALGALVAKKVSDCYTKARELKDKAIQATTSADLAKIKWQLCKNSLRLLCAKLAMMGVTIHLRGDFITIAKILNTSESSCQKALKAMALQIQALIYLCENTARD